METEYINQQAFVVILHGDEPTAEELLAYAASVDAIETPQNEDQEQDIYLVQFPDEPEIFHLTEEQLRRNERLFVLVSFTPCGHTTRMMYEAIVGCGGQEQLESGEPIVLPAGYCCQCEEDKSAARAYAEELIAKLPKRKSLPITIR